MTLNDIFLRLHSIDRKAQGLVSEAGFHSSVGLGSQVGMDPDDPDDRFLQNAACHLLCPFEDLHDFLGYLSRPVHGEYQIQKFPEGRYGYIDSQNRPHIFTCGSSFEALIPDNNGQPLWTRVRVEHNENNYFLFNHSGIPLSGLTVRERR